MSTAQRVLIVDDNIINAELANAHFRRSGWTTAVVENGTAALAATAASRFDLVLLDISMPGMSGVDVCRVIRHQAQEPRPRIVAYTAHAMNDERATLLEAGFDDILTKPVDRRAIQDMLERMGLAPRAGTPPART